MTQGLPLLMYPDQVSLLEDPPLQCSVEIKYMESDMTEINRYNQNGMKHIVRTKMLFVAVYMVK